MFYALANGKVRVDGYEVRHVLEDIQTLNQKALTGAYEITAISAAAYPHVADKYWVLSTGASVGRNYGPILVATKPMDLHALQGKRIAVPGALTTAMLLLHFYVRKFTPVELPFDQIFSAVKSGQVECGLIIHEGQLTYQQEGFAKVLDLGECWEHDTHLPLPLGLDVVRQDVGMPLATQINRALRESINYGFMHEEEALTYALQYGRGMPRALGRKFVGMYVNQDTLDLGEDGKHALDTLYTRAHHAHLIPSIPQLTII